MDLKFSENVISGREEPYEGCYRPMVDLSNYNFNLIMDKTVKPEESFINSYVNECLESDIIISAAHRMCTILDAMAKRST